MLDTLGCVLVLSSLLNICSGDVGTFLPCLKYFYKKSPPEGLQGTPICQRFDNQHRFATLYSRERRTPLYSAYIITKPQGKRPENIWKYEPQLLRVEKQTDKLLFSVQFYTTSVSSKSSESTLWCSSFFEGPRQEGLQWCRDSVFHHLHSMFYSELHLDQGHCSMIEPCFK